MFYTYILENDKGSLYIGQTNNMAIRLKWHNEGRSKYTKGKGPWKVEYMKSFISRPEAIKHERYLKSLKNKRYIKVLLSKENENHIGV